MLTIIGVIITPTARLTVLAKLRGQNETHRRLGLLVAWFRFYELLKNELMFEVSGVAVFEAHFDTDNKGAPSDGVEEKSARCDRALGADVLYWLRECRMKRVLHALYFLQRPLISFLLRDVFPVVIEE